MKSNRIAILTAGLILLAGFFGTAPSHPAGAAVVYLDSDRDGRDSPGDELRLGNSVLTLRFLYADLGSNKSRVSPRRNGWFLDSVVYRGEKFFEHPGRGEAPALYPALIANDAVGMTAFVRDALYQDDPFLWLWNAKEPRKSGPALKFLPPVYLESYQWYTLYEQHAEKDGTLVFSSQKTRDLREQLAFELSGPRLAIRYTAANQSASTLSLSGIITFPANRIIDTVFTSPNRKVSRQIAPTAFSDNYTCRLADSNGLRGSGMVFWARGVRSLLHLDGLLSFHRMNLGPGQNGEGQMTLEFLDQNIDDYYRDYLAANHIAFDSLDWDEMEKELVAMVPAVIMDQGYIYHTYDYNPPGTNRDWHNEMTGRAFIVKYLETGARDWLDYTSRANNYYVGRMFYDDPRHVCYGYFKDQTFADKLVDCFPWSQPYNAESLIAEFAVTKEDRLREVLLTHFQRMFSGSLYNADGKRWYWRVRSAGPPDDFGVFDSLEFGADDMISAYEFTGDRKYLDRAVETVSRSKHALDNFGLLLEDRAGEPSVNTSAFAAKLLFKLYEYTGDEYWKDRAIRVLNAVLYSRVFMEPYPEKDRWLNGALSRKDGDWKGQFGPPTTGTDSSAPSQTSFIPWVNEALVAGYNHTGNPLYLQYLAQLLHHQREANRRLAAATNGKAFACGHYNLYSEKFQEDNDGLTVVSNLFLFPYVKAFLQGFRSPHSSILLLPGPTPSSLRLFHLSGRPEPITLIIPDNASVSSVHSTDNNGKIISPLEFKPAGHSISFNANPYSMYLVKIAREGK